MTSVSARVARDQLASAKADLDAANEIVEYARQDLVSAERVATAAQQVVAMWQEVLGMIQARDDFEEDTRA